MVAIRDAGREELKRVINILEDVSPLRGMKVECGRLTREFDVALFI